MKQLKHPLMIVGTGSDVGKSVLAAGFCRIFLQDGYKPVPFKAQNMSLNSYVTSNGGEIGRAQAVQAEACRVDCHTDMNPVLLKPGSDRQSQVIVNGKVFGNYSAGSYFRGEIKDELSAEVMKAFNRLRNQYNPVVIEGAGSIAELNLKNNDIVNMQMATSANAATILVADIERGGVFASVYGSIKLLEPEEQEQIKGIIINKFRGDISLFDEGRKIIENLTGVPVLGIIPAFHHIHIEEEDSVSLERKATFAIDNKINVAVIHLRRLSNFTDFNRLEQDERVNLYYTNNIEEIRKADVIILPGSKSTIADLIELRRNGVAAEIIRQSRSGKGIIGICGGYQMMGQRIEDPNHVEGTVDAVPGLNLLPVVTTLEAEKATVRTSFRFKDLDEVCDGYEIHMGQTCFAKNVRFLNQLVACGTEGCLLNDRIWGTYMHGILDNPVVLEDLLSPFISARTEVKSYEEFKQEQYDLLANHLREHIDMAKIYKMLTE
jgi:adenosylcobyric acid synthase